MSRNKVSIAVLGCGAWGKNHIRVWNQLGKLRIACDSDLSRLETVQTHYPKVEVSTDVAATIERPDISAVVIATPAPTHAVFALEALRAGKDVLVEKPMALSTDDGAELVKTARSLDSLLMVGHVLEFHPAVRKLLSLVLEGELGKLQYICSNRLNLGRIRTEENALWSFAPHDIAIMLRLLGSEPDQVSCHGGAYLNHGVADVTVTNLRFPGGVRGHIFVNWLHPFKEHRFVVIGERKMAVFDDTLPWAQKLTLYPHRVDWMGGQVPVAHKAEGTPIKLEKLEPLRNECEHFIHCVETRQSPLTDGASGLRVLHVLEQAQRSLEFQSAPAAARPEKKGTSYFAHPTSTIDPGAEIGEGTRIWHYSHVMPTARVGKRCILGQNVFVAPQVRIGNGVKIQNNVSLYQGVELEDDVFCGPSMVFTNVVNPRSAIERKEEFKPTLVRKGASIGANATILCGCTIGRFAFVGAGAVVTSDVPDYMLVHGVPAQAKGWMCRCGLGLEFKAAGAVEEAYCKGCQSCYVKDQEHVKQIQPEEVG